MIHHRANFILPNEDFRRPNKRPTHLSTPGFDTAWIRRLDSTPGFDAWIRRLDSSFARYQPFLINAIRANGANHRGQLLRIGIMFLCFITMRRVEKYKTVLCAS